MNSNTSIKPVEIKICNKPQIQKQLRKIFKYSTTNKEALVGIYGLFFQMDNIDKIEGHPIADKTLWTYIWKLFVQLDRNRHPEEFAGAIWVNKGWGMNSGLEPWSIDFSKCRVIYP